MVLESPQSQETKKVLKSLVAFEMKDSIYTAEACQGQRKVRKDIKMRVWLFLETEAVLHLTKTSAD